MAITYLSGERIQGSSEAGANESLGSAADLDVNSGSHPTGKRGNGYSVTSSQYAQAGGSGGSLSQFKFLHEPDCKWSISFWLLVASSGSGIQDGRGIMGTADGAASEIGLSLKMNGSSSLLMHMRGSDYAARPASNNGAIEEDGNWHHYVMTHDHTLATTNTTLYKDGSAFTMQGADGGGNKEDNSNSTSNHNNPFTIGGADTAEGGSFAFQIDDVSIYNRVLTNAEKVSLYNSGSSIDADDVSVVGLKAFWDMNESGDFINVTATDEKSTITNVPVGTRYEEVDTRTIYRKVNKTDSFTDSFTSSSAWSQTGDKWSVNTGNGRVQNAGYSSYSPNDYVHHDMGASFHACDQSFNLRFKVLAVGAGGYIEVGFVDNLTNGDGGDRLNIGLNTYTSGSGYGYTRIYDSINGTNHEVETASSVTPSGMYNTAIWMEMTFNSTTNVCTCKCFSDSGFTTPLNAGTQNLSHTLTMSDYQGLRYLFIGSMHAGGRTLDSGSYVDDITLYTGISDVDDAVSVEWQDKGTA